MIRRPPRSTLDRSSAASDVYKRQQPERDRPTPVVGFVAQIPFAAKEHNRTHLGREMKRSSLTTLPLRQDHQIAVGQTRPGLRAIAVGGGVDLGICLLYTSPSP